MSVPVLAMSTSNRWYRRKRLALQITIRSHMNFHTCNQLLFKRTTLIWSVCLSRTSILALIPLALRGVAYHELPAEALLRRNLLVYGLGGIAAPFVCIKLLDMLLGLLWG